MMFWLGFLFLVIAGGFGLVFGAILNTGNWLILIVQIGFLAVGATLCFVANIRLRR